MSKKRIINDTYPTFQRTILPNGVRVVTETIPSVRSISVGVWVHTGSRDEQAGEEGICHFIEHMVFKGTERRRMHQIARRMEFVGGYLNAFTGKEYTCYFARALDEHLGRAIDTVCDLVLEPTFPEKELQKEKDVVIEEMKMYEDAPEDYIFDLFEAEIYAGHPLAHPVIGMPETVQGFTRPQLLDFMDQHYTPNQIVLAVAGNARHADVVRLAEQAFARTARAPQDRTLVTPNGFSAKQVVAHRPIQQAHLVLGTRTIGVRHPNRVAVSVMNTILGGGMSSRLSQNIREKYGYCYNIYSFLNLHIDTGDFGVYMGTDPSKVARSKKLIFREFEKLRQEPVSGRMLSQAKNQVKGSMMLAQESMSNRMMRIGRQELYFERYTTLDKVIEEVEAVTAADVQAMAQEILDPAQYTTVTLLPGA